MARIAVPFTGITSQSNYNDGECRSLVNLRPEPGGVHRPVPPRKVVQELSQEYDIIFVHRGNDYENWIGVVNTGYNATVYNNIRDVPTVISSINEEINSVQQVGNTITLVTSSTLYYLLWQNGGYRFLGELPDLPVISFKTSDQMAEAEMYFINEYQVNVPRENLVQATKGLVYTAMDLLVNGGVVNGVYREGTPLLFDAHYIRYAFRLYDGSVTKHSPPILVIPVRKITGDEKIYSSIIIDDLQHLGNDSLKYITYQIFGGTLTDISRINVFGYKIYMWYDFGLGGNYQQWADIIKSVDIFMSAPLGISNIENIRGDMPMDNATTLPQLRFRQCNLIKGIHETAAKNLRESSTFYFVKSFDLGTTRSIFNPEAFPESDEDKYKVNSIIYQEEMSDDSFSHHKIGGKISNALNSRLYLSDIKTTFFNGFNIDFFQWNSDYNGTQYVSGNHGYVVSEVEINIGTKIEKVYSILSSGFATTPNPFLSSFLSYPDPRARKMTIYTVDNGGTDWKRVLQFNLIEHKGLNLSYYLADGLNPIIATLGQTVSIPPVIGGTVSIDEQNKVKVSEVNNPFLFPVANTYQVGQGKIFNLASLVMNVSDRNYGMYPVFVFTSDGVYTLSSSDGNSVHAHVQAPSYLEPPISAVVCPTPAGVVFITQRGLMIINQHGTDYISPQLREDFGTIQLPDIGITNPSTGYPDKQFAEYLSGIELMLYNPYRNQLVIVDRESAYDWVYDFPSKNFHLSTEKISQVVQNSFPDIYVMDGVKLKDFSQTDSKTANVAVMTRPLLFRTPDLKKLERVMLRGVLHELNNSGDTDKAVVAVYHSNDGIHFECSRGMRVNKDGSYKDFDMGMFARVKRRGYVFLFVGNMDEESQLQCLEIETDKDYNNEKMR